MTGETKKRLCFGTILFYDEPERMKKAPKKKSQVLFGQVLFGKEAGRCG